MINGSNSFLNYLKLFSKFFWSQTDFFFFENRTVWSTYIVIISLSSMCNAHFAYLELKMPKCRILPSLKIGCEIYKTYLINAFNVEINWKCDKTKRTHHTNPVYKQCPCCWNIFRSPLTLGSRLSTVWSTAEGNAPRAVLSLIPSNKEISRILFISSLFEFKCLYFVGLQVIEFKIEIILWSSVKRCIFDHVFNYE